MTVLSAADSAKDLPMHKSGLTEEQIVAIQRSEAASEGC